MASSVLAPATVEYPSSDGTPVAESDFQLTPLVYAREALRDYFRDRRDVYVAANLFIYYEEGRRDAVAPDVFVVLGAANHERHTYRLWQEPKAPDFVMEVTSRSTWREDQERKRKLYGELGVTEYWQYDPTGDYLQPRLQGEYLESREYRRMRDQGTGACDQRMYSKVLGLELRVSARGFRFFDPVAGQEILSFTERGEAQQRAERGWRQERQEREREQQERELAERGWQRAEQERQRERQEAEARIAELEARLRDRGGADRQTSPA